MVMSSTYQYQKVAFLDTNVVHYIGLYLEFAKTNEVFPWDDGLEDDGRGGGDEGIGCARWRRGA